jgi:hypothetical protein
MADITERARSLVALYDRSGKPAILPDTPAGRMLLRESIAILRDLAAVAQVARTSHLHGRTGHA